MPVRFWEYIVGDAISSVLQKLNPKSETYCVLSKQALI